MKNKILYTLTCAAIAVALAGCDQKLSSDTNSTEDSNVSFTDKVSATFGDMYNSIASSTITKACDENSSCQSEDNVSDDKVIP